MLIKALNAYGNKQMAEDFLNRGNSRLEEAARRWATAHGYTVIKLPSGGTRPAWGSGR